MRKLESLAGVSDFDAAQFKLTRPAALAAIVRPSPGQYPRFV